MKVKFLKYKKIILFLFLVLGCVLLIPRQIFVTETFENDTLKKTYSQLGQDLNVSKYFDYKKNGYFVDIGAYDGIEYSNTYLLEKKYNWKGICIEVVPSIFNKLKKNRPDVITVNTAVYNTNGDTVEISESNMLSGITKDIDKHVHAKEGKSVKQTTKTLTKILEENNAPSYIDYMSLDTEGSEYKILQGIDFNKYTFGYLNIEHNNIEPRRTQMRKLLEQNDYVYLAENDVDDVYVHKSKIKN